MTNARFSSPRVAARSIAAATIVLAAAVFLPEVAAQSRGQLLYDTHCVACHTAQVHWRDKKLVGDWASLKAQVQRWQQVSSLGWPAADVVEVSRYLNNTIYHIEKNADRLTLVAPPASGAPR